jgi:hypothetical protein
VSINSNEQESNLYFQPVRSSKQTCACGVSVQILHTFCSEISKLCFSSEKHLSGVPVQQEQQEQQVQQVQQVQQAPQVQQRQDVRLQQRNRRSGPFCFHGETQVNQKTGASRRRNLCCLQVETETGRKEMKDLRIGERILVVNDDQLIYAPVTSFLHRMPEQEAVFIVITTSDSKTIRLTSEHLLYTTKCNEPIALQHTWRLVFAREVQVSESA